ncbi:hypothetical protein GCK32_009747 [Trichostrongylus colubriformis]|uniref:Uncharacterized protein n=1 Tax=Trichostrongylus colubriformis TaxID=6319 RepID=A0AAN8FBF3_TRICO
MGGFASQGLKSLSCFFLKSGIVGYGEMNITVGNREWFGSIGRSLTACGRTASNGCGGYDDEQNQYWDAVKSPTNRARHRCQGRSRRVGSLPVPPIERWDPLKLLGLIDSWTTCTKELAAKVLLAQPPGLAVTGRMGPLKRQERRNPVGRGMSRPVRGMGGGGMAGRPMRGGPMGMMNPGFGRPGPYGMGPMGGFGNRGPMPFGGPGGPGGPMGNPPIDPNISFFNVPQPVGPPMGDARTGPMQSGQQTTPSAGTVGKGSVGGTANTMSNQPDSNNSNNGNKSTEVPGFGANSSIHELFGKMVWKKMEGIRDNAVVDRLQNRIMNMIHEALAQQSDGSNGGGGSNQGASVNGNQSTGNFRSY